MASRTAAETTAGGPATPSAVGDMAPLLEWVRGADNVGIKDRGSKARTANEYVDLKVDNTGGAIRMACNAVSRVQHGASPGGGPHSATPEGGEGRQ